VTGAHKRYENKTHPFFPCLTARVTSRAGTQVGGSDPDIFSGKIFDQWIKGTPGITGLCPPRDLIDAGVRHINVGSECPRAAVGPKGWTVRPLILNANLVYTAVMQVGSYFCLLR
jgi:Family of unknown function (DUF6467)